MVQRCEDPNFIGYKYYGGRGVRVCDRWLHGTPGISGFKWFLVEMGLRPPDKPTIDRIDPDGDYERSNCRWADYFEQNANRRPFARGKRGPAKRKEAA